MDGYNDASMRNEGGCSKCPFRVDAVDHYECNNPDSIHYEESVNHDFVLSTAFCVGSWP